MGKNHDSQDDPLQAVLVRQDNLIGGDHLRQAVLQRTLGVIRHRRRLKRLGVAAALVGCYLAGIATIAVYRSAGEHGSKSPSEEIAVNSTATSDAASLLIADLGGPPDQKPKSPPLSQFEVLRRAGDRYLKDPEKLQLAVRTYSRTLKHASADQRAISSEHDSWLFMALKDAYSKEIKNDNSQL